MKENRMKAVFESIAQRDVPADANLWPRIAAKVERKASVTILRTRPVVAILIALLVLLVLSGIAYALDRSLGYIPGYGVVEQNVPMLVLAEPISQTRDEITITINEIILTSDKMYGTVTTENIPSNLILPLSDTTTVTCQGNWVYQLPDGSQLSFEFGSGAGTMEPLDSKPGRTSYRESGYVKFSNPINLNKITDMALLIPCVTADIPVGSLPENWEFHLRFVPAPAGSMAEKTAFPIIEYTPSPVPTNVTETPEVNPISITKAIDAGDSYILMGEFIPPAGSSLSNDCCTLSLFDASGREIDWEMPMDIDPGTPTANIPFAFSWVSKFEKDGLTLPITVKVTDLPWRSILVPFEFDAGDHPKLGDEWQINQSFEVSGRIYTLEKIRVVRPQIPGQEGEYMFSFTYPLDENTIGLTDISIEGYSQISGGTSGGGSSGEPAEPTPTRHHLDQTVGFASLPKGNLTVQFTFKVADREHEQHWTLTWQP